MPSPPQFHEGDPQCGRQSQGLIQHQVVAGLWKLRERGPAGSMGPLPIDPLPERRSLGMDESERTARPLKFERRRVEDEFRPEVRVEAPPPLARLGLNQTVACDVVQNEKILAVLRRFETKSAQGRFKRRESPRPARSANLHFRTHTGIQEDDPAEPVTIRDRRLRSCSRTETVRYDHWGYRRGAGHRRRVGRAEDFLDMVVVAISISPVGSTHARQ